MADTASPMRGTGPIALAIFGGAAFIAGAIAVNGCAQRNLDARTAGAARVLEAINTDPVQAAKNLRFLVNAELVTDKQQREHLSKLLPTIQIGHGPALGPSVATSQCAMPSNARSDLKIEWLNIECGYWFPANDGFDGKPKSETIAVGKVIDRYGGAGGNFLAPTDVTYEQRALPYDMAKMRYTRYEVVKPLTATSGAAARWFDQSGGGLQYKTSKPVQALIDGGILKEVPK